MKKCLHVKPRGYLTNTLFRIPDIKKSLSRKTISFPSAIHENQITVISQKGEKTIYVKVCINLGNSKQVKSVYPFLTDMQRRNVYM